PVFGDPLQAGLADHALRVVGPAELAEFLRGDRAGGAHNPGGQAGRDRGALLHVLEHGAGQRVDRGLDLLVTRLADGEDRLEVRRVRLGLRERGATCGFVGPAATSAVVSDFGFLTRLPSSPTITTCACVVSGAPPAPRMGARAGQLVRSLSLSPAR